MLLFLNITCSKWGLSLLMIHTGTHQSRVKFTVGVKRFCTGRDVIITYVIDMD